MSISGLTVHRRVKCCPAVTSCLPAPARTVEAWAEQYIRSTSLREKCAPTEPPEAWESKPSRADIRPLERPPELTVTPRAPASPRPRALSEPRARAQLLHTFWFHELQAAELMCWALLKFSDAEPEFRRGLLRIWRDEVRHMSMYAEHIESLGFRLGAFPVREWFWQRVPECESKVSFVALLGMGLEAANLEHAPRFAEWFRGVGDEVGAALQQRVATEEVAHVRFATRWFKQWAGTDDFETWVEYLPRPLSPLLMRGKTINKKARLNAGMSEEFIERLATYEPEPHGR